MVNCMDVGMVWRNLTIRRGMETWFSGYNLHSHITAIYCSNITLVCILFGHSYIPFYFNTAWKNAQWSWHKMDAITPHSPLNCSVHVPFACNIVHVRIMEHFKFNGSKFRRLQHAWILILSKYFRQYSLGYLGFEVFWTVF